MRRFVLLAAAALAVSACRNHDQADTATNLDSGLTAENIASNDVTAIDAVTADAANMAADVDYAQSLDELTNNVGNSAAPSAKSGGAKPKTSHSAPAPAAAPDAASNVATNAQ